MFLCHSFEKIMQFCYTCYAKMGQTFSVKISLSLMCDVLYYEILEIYIQVFTKLKCKETFKLKFKCVIQKNYKYTFAKLVHF